MSKELLKDAMKSEIILFKKDKYFSFAGMLYPTKKVTQLLKTFKKHDTWTYSIDSKELIITWNNQGTMTFKGRDYVWSSPK